MFKRFLSFAFIALITCSSFAAEPNYVDQFNNYYAGRTAAPVRPDGPSQQAAFDAAKARRDFLNLTQLFAQFPDSIRAQVIEDHRAQWENLRERANAYFGVDSPNYLPHSLDAWEESFSTQRGGDNFRQRIVSTLTGHTELVGVPETQTGYAVKFLSSGADNQCYMYGMGMGMNPPLTARREAVQTIIDSLGTDRGPAYRRMIALQFINLATTGISAIGEEAEELALIPRLFVQEEFIPHQTFKILRAVANALSLAEYNAVLKGELLKVALGTPDLLEEIREAAGDVQIRANYKGVTLTRWVDDGEVEVYGEDAGLFTQHPTNHDMWSIKITGHETVAEGARKYQFLHNNQDLMSSGERQAAFRALGRALNRTLGREESTALSADDLTGLETGDHREEALTVHAPILSLTLRTGRDPILFKGTETVRDAFTKLEQLVLYSEAQNVRGLTHQESGGKSPDSLIADVRDAYSHAIHTALAGVDLNAIMHRPEVYNALMTRIKDNPDTFAKKKLVALLGLKEISDDPLPGLNNTTQQLIEVETRNGFEMDYPVWVAIQNALAVTQDNAELRNSVLNILSEAPRSERTDLIATFVNEYFGPAGKYTDTTKKTFIPGTMLELTPPTDAEEVGVGSVIAHRTGNRIFSAYPRSGNKLEILFAVGPAEGRHKRIVWRTNEYHGDTAILVIPGQEIDLDDLTMRIAHENRTRRLFPSNREKEEEAAKKAAAAKLLAAKKLAAATKSSSVEVKKTTTPVEVTIAPAKRVIRRDGNKTQSSTSKNPSSGKLSQ